MRKSLAQDVAPALLHEVAGTHGPDQGQRDLNESGHRPREPEVLPGNEPDRKRRIGHHERLGDPSKREKELIQRPLLARNEEALGRKVGVALEEAVAALGMVAEGVPNTLSIHEAARRAGVRTPIIDSVYGILYEGKSAPLAMQQLLTRDPRPEHS